MWRQTTCERPGISNAEAVPRAGHKCRTPLTRQDPAPMARVPACACAASGYCSRMPERNPINPTDDDARALAHRLLSAARFGALGVIDPQTGAPSVTRVAIGTAPDGAPLTLVSDLSSHTPALKAHPACSLLLGEPGDRGDPLTHPRMTLNCEATFVAHGGPGWLELRAHYLAQHPKAKLYIDFTDFSFVRLEVQAVALNGGFGKAYHLTPADLRP